MICKRNGIILLAALILILSLVLLLWQARAPDRIDPNAIASTGKTRLTKEELLQQLQQQTDDSAFRFRMETNPSVHGDIADLLLENPVENHFDIQVVITLDKSHKTIFKSDILHPGAQLLQAKLKKKLSPGSHKATAHVSILDSSTGKPLQGSMNFALTLDVTAADS